MDKKYRTFSELLVEKLKNDSELADIFLRSAIDDYSKDMNKEALLLSLRHLAEARGFSKTARESGLTRDVFYKSLLPNGNPKLDTVMAILRALKYTITIRPLETAR
ncbi:addiction module antitoxin [Alphaproteobacteria bacterium]|nr:addiction module antitoxin [Alphaproteobacteria bacterium]